MDTGHHNCRDYYLEPPASIDTQTILSERKSRATTTKFPLRSSQPSPLNAPTHPTTAFPFLRLPFELRQHIYACLLPTAELVSNAPGRHVLGPAAVVRAAAPKPEAGRDSVIWKRGQTSLLCVNKQLFSECSNLIYGSNTFVLFVAYDSITFRFRYWLPHGLAPSHNYKFLDLIEPKYLRKIRRIALIIEHVDSYTGMIKFNVGGKGLTHGLREQVETLVEALKTDDPDDGVTRIQVKLLNGNNHLDAEQRTIVKRREASTGENHDVQTVLEPLGALRGLVEVSISGAVSADYARRLKARMMDGF